jgi:hypothetical protein
MYERTLAMVDIAKRVTATLTNELQNAKTPEEASAALKRIVSFAIPAEWGMYLLTGTSPDDDTAARVITAAMVRMNNDGTNKA